MSAAMSEEVLRARLPVYVGSFNQPSYLRQMVETLSRNGFGNVIVADNASTSPKTIDLLADYDARGGVTVWRQGENLGPHQTVQRIMERAKGPFVFTDPDISLSETLPDDFLTTLFALSRRYRCRKVGLALEIPAPGESRDLVFHLPPIGSFTIQEWEKRFWEHELEPGVYRAQVDTTFFLWNADIHTDFRRSYKHFRNSLRPRRLARRLPDVWHTDIRVARAGFPARHLPWYKDDLFPEDERAFYKQTATRASTWLRDSE